MQNNHKRRQSPQRLFRPEFLNRVDETIVFHALEKEHILAIVDLMMKELHKRLQEQEIGMEVSVEAKEKLVADIYGGIKAQLKVLK